MSAMIRFKNLRYSILLLSCTVCCMTGFSQIRQDSDSADRWTEQKANEWYKGKDWLRGCNFQPSTAINQLEMWQADTFDPATIDRELGWAEKIGHCSEA